MDLGVDPSGSFVPTLRIAAALAALACACSGIIDGSGSSDPSGSDGGASGDDGGGAGGGLRAATSPELPVIGVAVSAAALRDADRYAAIVAREFNSVTPENAMKWDATEPTRGAMVFDDADALVAFAEDRGQRVRGHTLVWYLQLPSWVNDALTSDELGAAMDARIDALVSRYRGRVATWDVVNEAIDDLGQPRDSIFLRKLGIAYVERAFRRARAADPDAELVYNDYGIEEPNAKSDAVYAMIADFVARGVPIDAVGFQFHVSGYELASSDLREQEIRSNIQRFAALGVSVQITELDLRVATLPGERAARLDYQARAYQRLVDICRSEPGCTSLTLWGVGDAWSWIDGALGPDDPLLFDDDLEPKPAYHGVLAALGGDAGPGLDDGLDTDCASALGGAAWCAPFEATGFETLTFGRDYRSEVGGGAVALSTDAPGRGARSLRATAGPTSGAQALVGRSALPPVTSGMIYLRALIYVPASVTAGTVTLLSVGEAAPPYAGVAVGMSGGKFQLSFTTAGSYPVSSVTVPRGSWHCVDLAVRVSDGDGAATLRMDGAQVQSVTGLDTRPAGGISNGNAGILYLAPAGASAEARFDEVAFGTAPLSCDPL